MDSKKLKGILAEHKKWISGDGGSKADLGWANLSRANLGGANLNRANLSGANLSRANLSGADLSMADLGWANLSGADLSGAYLRKADLSGADLSGAYLSGANLSMANLGGANLNRANLGGANLNRADLSWANLQQTKGLIYAQCSFSNHGECGRMLTGVIINNNEVYFCGCFKGSLDDLKNYINKGNVKYKESRTIAMQFVSARLKEAVMGEK